MVNINRATPLVSAVSVRANPAGRRRRSLNAPGAAALHITAGFGLFLLFALAGCEQASTPPDNSQTPVVTIAPAASVAEGSPLTFPVRAKPAPAADLTVGVTIVSSDCELKQAPKSVTITAGKTEATLSVPTSDAGVGPDGCTVTATIAAGEGYQVGAATAASASVTLTPEPGTPMQPVVTITEDSESVTEGFPVSFTLTATPPPASALTVNVSWSYEGSFLTGSPPQTVTIPTDGTETLTAGTADDNADETDGWVTATVEAGSGYTVGSSRAATVVVTDNDPTSPGPTSPGPTSPGRPPATLYIGTTTPEVTEGQPIYITVSGSGTASGDVHTTLHWSGDVDRLLNPPTTYAFGRFSTPGTRIGQAVRVNTRNNSVKDGTAEVAVRVSIVGSSSGVVVAQESTVSITIRDND